MPARSKAISLASPPLAAAMLPTLASSRSMPWAATARWAWASTWSMMDRAAAAAASISPQPFSPCENAIAGMPNRKPSMAAATVPDIPAVRVAVDVPAVGVRVPEPLAVAATSTGQSPPGSYSVSVSRLAAAMDRLVVGDPADPHTDLGPLIDAIAEAARRSLKEVVAGDAELRRICSFPDDFVLEGSYQQQWERCGRAVPPG